jgi:outer membrane receptor protein involved in Fe transport
MNRVDPASRQAPRTRLPHLRLATLGLLLLALIPGLRSAAEVARDFDVPAGQARDTLKRFAAQAQVEIVFPSENTLGVATNAVRGRLSPEEAMTALLAGTNLTAIRDPKTGAFSVRPRPSDPNAPATPARSPSVSAQAVASGSDPGSAGDVPVQLSPFEVKSVDTAGYLAAEATSGTRYATPILETPIAVNTITRDFIEDFQLIDTTGQDMLAFTSSFTFTGGTGAINLRGIRGFSVYKNGIREGGVLGPASLERAEVIKGANAAIYGQAEPSGMVNRITKKGQERPFYELLVTGGTGATSRTQVDVNQPLIQGRLLSRWAASYEHNRFGWQDFANFKRTNLYGSTTWKIDGSTSLTINSEYIWFRSHTQTAEQMPFVFVPVVVNRATSNQFIGMFGLGEFERYAHINTLGPTTYNQVEYTQIDGTLSRRINSWLTTRLLGAYWNRNQNQSNYERSGTNVNAYNSATGVLQGTQTPRIMKSRGTQVNAQVDLLAEFNTGAITHKALLTFDYKSSASLSAERRTSLAQYSMPLQNYLTGGPNSVPGFPYEYDFNHTVWNVNLRRVETEDVTSGVMLSERLGFMQNRWLFIVGGRRDLLRRQQVDHLNPLRSSSALAAAGQWMDYGEDAANTYQTGTLFRVTNDLSVFANMSSSFLPQRGDGVYWDADGNPLDPQVGFGVEGGFKILLANQRLSLTFGGYDLHRTNIPRTARDPAGNVIQIPGVTPGTTRQYSTVADVRSKGLELDGIWSPSDNVSFTLGVGYNRIRYSKIPNATEQYLLGTTPEGSPEWTGGTTVSYRFTGERLKGLAVRASLRFNGEALINNNTLSIYGTSGVEGPPVTIGGEQFKRYYFKNPSYSVVGLGVTYRWKSARLSQAVTLDVGNVLDELYFRTRKPGDPRSFLLGYRLKL